jgi:GNAT superfamily N-acetyltransferase
LFPFADAGLSRRLERTEATGNARFVEARASLFPQLGATWVEVAGAYAMYDGPASPLTQTFCLGLFQALEADHLQALETFFQSRGAAVAHEVSPLAGADLAARLNRRGYVCSEFTSVMYRPIGAGAINGRSAGGSVAARLALAAEEETWTGTAAEGWSEFPELEGFMADVGRVTFNTRGTFPFLAEAGGHAIAAGALTIHEGVALLAGASTRPGARGQGAQSALLEARLRYAVEKGCDLAMMAAQPGSASQRNAERNGFRIAYTRAKWELRAGTGAAR